MSDDSKKRQYNGRLAVPLDFDEAVKAALEVKPPEKKPRRPRAKKQGKQD